MRKTLVLMAVMAVAFSFTACSNCGGTEGNCDVGWDFYSECDLIEGQQRMCANNGPCGGPCGPAPCGPGVEGMSCSPCGTMAAPSAAPCGTPMPMAPATPAPMMIIEDATESTVVDTPMPAPIVSGDMMPPANQPLDIDPLSTGR